MTPSAPATQLRRSLPDSGWQLRVISTRKPSASSPCLATERSRGLAYEGLNNAGASGRDFIVILNDNEMSIAPNVGAMSKYLTSIQRNPLYNRVRSAIGSVVESSPSKLKSVGTLVKKWEESMKAFLTPGVLFEELGFRYFGPIDGHDMDALVETMRTVRELKG